MAASIVSSEQEFRNIIKAPPGTVTAKILSGPLRSSPSEFLAASRLGVMTTVASSGSRQIFAVGGAAGFVTQDPANGDLILPAPGDVDDAASFGGVLLMVPGVRHTFRVNGPVALQGDSLRLTPNESYAHCAKAFIRSALWSDRTSPTSVEVGAKGELDDAARSFIAAAPFAAIGTSGATSDADVSPRGDPAGFVQVLEDGQLFIPERPGNRIADSLRNIIANPAVALLFFVPGDGRTLEVVGDAVISTEDNLRAAAEVGGKQPKLGIVVTVRSATLAGEPALAASGAWDTTTHAAESDLPSLGALVADPKQVGSLAKRALTGITDLAVNTDYKRNLY